MPLNPYLIEICPDNKLINDDGIKKGEILRGPLEFKVIEPLKIGSRPPTSQNPSQIPSPATLYINWFQISFQNAPSLRKA